MNCKTIKLKTRKVKQPKEVMVSREGVLSYLRKIRQARQWTELKLQIREHVAKEHEAAVPVTITASEVLNGATWEHTDFSGKSERAALHKTKEPTTLYLVVAGDNQSPCRWNGRQLTVEWIDESGVPLFSNEQALAAIEQTYSFFKSIGRTAHPILRVVPVFQLLTI